MFPKAKRFAEKASCAPPVGKYNLAGENEKKKGAVPFSKSKRFVEPKEMGPGPADTSCSLTSLDVSNCSIISNKSDTHSLKEFVSPLPLKKAQKCGLSSSTPEMSQTKDLEKKIRHLMQEKTEMESQLVAAQEDIKRLEGKLQESSITETTSENLKNQLDSVMKQPHEKEQALMDLRMDVRCQVESINADLKAERCQNLSLNERVQTLENHNQEVIGDRDQAEEEIRRLHGIIDQLRSEYDLIKKNLEQKEEELRLLGEKMESCLKEGESKIKSLHDTVCQEMEKSKALEQQLEDCHQEYKTKLSDAQGDSEKLKIVQTELEEKVESLEDKLVKVLEREQQAQDRASCLEAEKIASEGHLQSCVTEYEQRLTSNAAQIKSLQDELTCSEEMMTENLRSLTTKYEALEEFHANFKSKRDSDLERVSAELDATKTSLTNSKEECTQYQCVVEDLREEMTIMEGKIQELTSNSKSLFGKLQEEESAKVAVEEKLAQIIQEKESEIAAASAQCQQHEDTISCLKEREKLLARELERSLCTQSQQDEELTATKEELERIKYEAKETRDQLYSQVERYKAENERTSLQLKEMEEQKGRETSRAEERTLKIKEEFGRRLVETQKKLSQTEMNFSRFKEEQEIKLKRVIEDGERSKEECAKQIQSEVQGMYERKLLAARDEIEILEEKLNRKSLVDDSDVANMKAETERWRSKCLELEEKIAPFKEQLENFEAERKALLSQNSQAQDEVAKLGQQYAKLLGHQNQKQKIHHVQKLKEENLGLKSEVRRLTEQCEKLKRSMKRFEEKFDGPSKKRFDPSKAFNHSSRKENTPLSVISNGNVVTKRS